MANNDGFIPNGFDIFDLIDGLSNGALIGAYPLNIEAFLNRFEEECRKFDVSDSVKLRDACYKIENSIEKIKDTPTLSESKKFLEEVFLTLNKYRYVLAQTQKTADQYYDLNKSRESNIFDRIESISMIVKRGAFPKNKTGYIEDFNNELSQLDIDSLEILNKGRNLLNRTIASLTTDNDFLSKILVSVKINIIRLNKLKLKGTNND